MGVNNSRGSASIKPATGYLKGSCHDDYNNGTRQRGVLSNDAREWLLKRNVSTLSQSVSFIPWIIQQGIRDNTVISGPNHNIVVHKCYGAVVFSDASGFTKLTEALERKSNGAELLSLCLNKFFTPLIDIINSYRGDVIKFSGDALTILFPAICDYDYDYPCGSGWSNCKGHNDLQLATLRASACCIEIHKRLHNFDTGQNDVYLTLHIGVGAGPVTILQVGGQKPPHSNVTRFEYVIAGPPLEQISKAEPMAGSGETVLSPEAWELVKDTVLEGEPLLDDECIGFHRLLSMDVNKHTYATIKNAAKDADRREEMYALRINELYIAKWFIPPAVFKQIENDTIAYVNEMRTVTTIFISVPEAIDVSTSNGALIAQKLMEAVQTSCYEQEGDVNKFLVDDKGLLFLAMFGTPPMVHIDDPLRAVLSAIAIVKTLTTQLRLTCKIGITTGRVYSGVVGSNCRQEYTLLGDSVNTSARLMANAPINSIYTDKPTYDLSKNDIPFIKHEPIKVKGKDNKIQVFEPQETHNNTSPDGIIPELSPLSPASDGAASSSSNVQTTTSATLTSTLPASLNNGNAAAAAPPPPPPPLRTTQRLTTMVKQTERMLPWRTLCDNVNQLANETAAAAAHNRDGGTSSATSSIVNNKSRGTLSGLLSELSSLWPEMDEVLNIIPNIGEDGGVLIIEGESGLGKDQVGELLMDELVNEHDALVLYGTHRGRPNEETKPLCELLESIVDAVLESPIAIDIGVIPKTTPKLKILSRFLNEAQKNGSAKAQNLNINGITVHEQTKAIEIPYLTQVLLKQQQQQQQQSGDGGGSEDNGSMLLIPDPYTRRSSLIPLREDIDKFFEIIISLIKELLKHRPVFILLKISR
ncbi:hypothetical protein FOL47_008614, partial [Perkinsus chesapeaki]